MSPPEHTADSTEVHSVSFTDGEQTVTATKLVSMGELLLLECEGDQIRLDAMLLEGLSWQQDAVSLAEFVRDPAPVLEDSASSYDARPAEPTDPFTISNEYATVTLGVVDTELTDALQIRSEKGISVFGPGTVSALTTVASTHELSKWFRTPIGPEQPL